MLSQFRKLAKEKGETPLFQETFMSGFIGEWLYQWSIRFTVYEKFVVISSVRKVLLRWEDITKVEIKPRVIPHLFSGGLQIRHKKSGVPEKIVLFVANETQVKNFLEQYLAKR